MSQLICFLFIIKIKFLFFLIPCNTVISDIRSSKVALILMRRSFAYIICFNFIITFIKLNYLNKVDVILQMVIFWVTFRTTPGKEYCSDKRWHVFILSHSRNTSVTVGTGWLVGWLVWFYGKSTFVGCLMPNPFLCK